MSTADLLALQARTAFVLDARGCMVAVNEPVAEKAAAPLVYAAYGEGGLVVLGRADVQAGVLLQVRRAIDNGEGDEAIDHALAEAGLAVTSTERGLSWLIESLPPPAGIGILSSGSAEGEALVARYAREGMPAAMVEAGFVSVDDFWAPWCAVMVGDEVASIAFAARLSDEAADVGLYTFPAFRQRGLGSAAVAAWAHHPELAGRTLFYAADGENFASHRVAHRLGLVFLGSTLTVR